ncbi:MAG: hypothetical protein MUE40_20160 [Anaerolineae bacterium]|nr:hypothetical protein [Anaerolineae bacterium]
MTLEELQQLIDERINEHLTHLLGQLEMDEEELFTDEEPDTRTWEQVKQDIERDRWTPPPGAKSSLELLREDRES